MEKLQLLLLLMMIAAVPNAQVSFLPDEDSPIVTVTSDSRSANIVDIDADGLQDIFISNGPSVGANNLIYFNTGNGVFVPVPDNDINQDDNPSDGATFGDIDNDGDLDAFVTSWHGAENLFYLNNFGGTFTLQENEGITGIGTYSETASWGDYNADGLLDLYVTNSTDFDTETDEVKRNLLFKNIGNGQLEPVTEGAPVEDAFISRSVNWVDYDNDNDLDLFVSNEAGQANNLYENTGGGSFQSVTGIAITQTNYSSMGSSWGDIDNDGDLDLFVCNYDDNNELFINEGNGEFTAVQQEPLTTDGGFSFGSTFGDYDNDGDLDLFVTNGFGATQLQNFLYLNQGDGTFIRDETSIPDLSTQCSFGAAWGDLDNNGFLDLLVTTCRRNGQLPVPNQLYYNQGNDHHWLKVKLQGTASNYYGIGAKVYLKAVINGEPAWQLRQISAQDGYNCQNSLLAHFGLGSSSSVDSIRIEWPSGIVDHFVPLEIDTTVTIVEGVNTSVDIAAEAYQLKVYPNPAGGDTIYVQVPEKLKGQHLKLTVYNNQGQQVHQQEATPAGDMLEMKAAHLATGAYVLKITSNDGLVLNHPLIVY